MQTIAQLTRSLALTYPDLSPDYLKVKIHRERERLGLGQKIGQGKTCAYVLTDQEAEIIITELLERKAEDGNS